MEQRPYLCLSEEKKSRRGHTDRFGPFRGERTGDKRRGGDVPEEAWVRDCTKIGEGGKGRTRDRF